MRRSVMNAAVVMTVLTAGAGWAQKVPVPENGCYLSAYCENGYANFETLTGKELAIDMFYVNFDMANFPATMCNQMVARGSIPHLSWEPFGAGNDNQSIIDGKKDDYIRRWAQQIKSWGKPLFIRWALEMNGNWYPWDGTSSGGATKDGFGDPTLPDGPERFVAAYRHIHDIFVAEGVDNVSWVFAPNIISEPNVAWNKIANYYPGAAYVDWLGLDGYNWGNTNGGRWQSFDQVYTGPYAEICALGDQPVMIAEFASAEIGGDKALWIGDAYEKIKNSYTRMKAVTWFHINKETDWRVNSSDAALQAYQQVISDPYFLSAPPQPVTGSRFPGRQEPGIGSVFVHPLPDGMRIGTGLATAWDLQVSTLQGREIVRRQGCEPTVSFASLHLPAGTYLVHLRSVPGSWYGPVSVIR